MHERASTAAAGVHPGDQRGDADGTRYELGARYNLLWDTAVDEKGVIQWRGRLGRAEFRVQACRCRAEQVIEIAVLRNEPKSRSLSPDSTSIQMSGSTPLISTFAREKNAASQSEIAGRAASRLRPIEKYSINISITQNPNLLDLTDVPVIPGRAACCSLVTLPPQISNIVERKLNGNWSKVR